MTRSTEPPIPKAALSELETELRALRPSVTTKGWDRCPPLVVTPRPTRAVEGAWFDVAAVVRVVRAFTSLRHTKGRWGGRPFVPDPWEIVWVLAPIFGWKHPDGSRIIRTAWIEVPKKNGKSTLASGLGLVLLAADGEYGAEVYAAATAREQARIVYDEAGRMARRSPALRARLQVLSSVIRAPRTGGIFRALSRIADIAHGINVSGAIVDEVHAHKTGALIDAIEQGTAARRQPLVIFITTADEGDEGSIYAEKHNYVRKIAGRIIRDPTTYGVIWAAEEDADPFDPKVWARANPGLGVSVAEAYLRKEAEKARVTPRYLPVFLRMHLNRRARPASRFFRLADWDATAGIVDEQALRGREAYGGLDLSSTQDLTALLLLFPPEDPEGDFEALAQFWLPADDLQGRVERDQVPYDRWAQEGFLTLTEGNVVDYAPVREAIVAAAKRYRLRRLSYDRMFAGELITEVSQHVEVAPVSQTFLGLSPATKELERLVLQGRFRHGGHPVLRFCADCVEVVRDQQDNIKPTKPDRQKTSKRIDGISAAVMALDGWIRRGDEQDQRRAPRVRSMAEGGA